MTISQRREARPQTALERARDTARIRRAREGRPLPRTVHALGMQGARLMPCDHCGARPGSRCTRPGEHLARYMAAEAAGLITRAELARVVAGLAVIAAQAIVTGEAS